MNYLSACSGIEAASVAWEPLGWKPVAFAEIEPFSSAVLAHHWPHVPNLGDITKYEEWPDIDATIVVGGTPCQSFSVAGLRRGLADPRGNLTLVFLSILDRVRPRWVVWENVPGVLSDKTGAFGAFLGGLAELGYGFAYRVLNAQYWGVPQRRRRVFVVGYLGDWRRAGAVLFEPESLCWDSSTDREAREDIAGTLNARTQCGGGLGTDFDLSGGLQIAHCRDIASSITSNYGKQPDSSDTALGPNIIAYSLRGEGFDARPADRRQRGPMAFRGRRGGKQSSLGASESGTGALGATKTPAIAAGIGVRRLMPVEAERLQGFPSNFTRIPWRGKPAEQCPDGPRYKAIGNSMAVPVMHWIGRRIASVEEFNRQQTRK